MSKDHYAALNPDASVEHPIERVVARRLQQPQLERKILRLQRAVSKALGPRVHSFVALTDLMGAAEYDRHAAYFNIGFEHGLAEGRGEAARKHLSMAAWSVVKDVCIRLRVAALDADEIVAVLAVALSEFAIHRSSR